MKFVTGVGMGIIVSLGFVTQQALGFDEFVKDHAATNKPASKMADRLRGKEGVQSPVKAGTGSDQKVQPVNDRKVQLGGDRKIQPAGDQKVQPVGDQTIQQPAGDQKVQPAQPVGVVVQPQVEPSGNNGGANKGEGRGRLKPDRIRINVDPKGQPPTPDVRPDVIKPDLAGGAAPATPPSAAPAWGPHSVVLLGNWQFAWESAVQAPTSPGADLVWKYEGPMKQYLEPQNGAKIAIVTGYENTSIEQMGNVAASLPASAFSTLRIPGGATPGSRLQPGTKLVMVTGEGDNAVFEIEGYRSSHDFTFSGAAALNGVKDGLQQQPEAQYYHLQIGGLWGRGARNIKPAHQK